MTTGDYWFQRLQKPSSGADTELPNRNASPRRSAAPIGSSSAQRASGAIR